MYSHICVFILFRQFNVSIPSKTRRNGTLNLHVFVYPQSQDPLTSQYTSHDYSAITTYMIPQSGVFNLLGDNGNKVSI